MILCRTSRAFLPIGRRLLYRLPFAGFSRISKTNWNRAIALYTALSRNGGALGRMVRGMYYLDVWCERLAALPVPDGPHAFDLRGQSNKAFAWQASMVAACPALRFVSVKVHSTSEATALHRALRLSTTSLEGIKMQSSSPAEVELALRLLANLYSAGARLKIIDLSHLGSAMTHTVPGECNPQLKSPVEVLSLGVGPAPENVKPFAAFFPVQAGVLRNLELVVPVKTIQSDLLHLLRLAGSSITDLALSSLWHDAVSERYSRYGVGFDGPVFPSEAIALFPHLENLQITSFGGLSMHRLGLIQQHCQSLQTLNVAGSTWLADNPALSALVTPQYQEIVFSEPQVIKLLEGMPELVEVHLGSVPVRATNRLPSLTLAMRAKGTSLDFLACSGRCPSCGDYHY
ncbi:hypothetical protein JCM3775_005268 [Rhodotorula graminis]